MEAVSEGDGAPPARAPLVVAWSPQAVGRRARRAVRDGVAVALTLLLVVGCGGDDLASSEAVTAYFDALASNDPQRHDEMLAAAQPGSPAYRFAAHHANVATAFASEQDAPPTTDPGTLAIDGDTVTIAYGPDRDQSRGYADVEVDDQSARLISFSESQPADAGQHVPIAETLNGGDGASASVFDATIELLSARKPAWSPQLGIALEVHTGDQPVRINAADRPLVTAPGRAPAEGVATTYETADGDTHVLHSVTGPTEVAANSTAVLLLVFEDVGLGGTVVLPVGSEGALSEAVIPVADHQG